MEALSQQQQARHRAALRPSVRIEGKFPNRPGHCGTGTACKVGAAIEQFLKSIKRVPASASSVAGPVRRASPENRTVLVCRNTTRVERLPYRNGIHILVPRGRGII